jgi:hypothetical protein
MNSLDALDPAQKGVGIVRVPSWQAGTDLAAGHLARHRSARRTSPRRAINRIVIQFLNRAKWPWYTKPLIDRVS